MSPLISTAAVTVLQHIPEDDVPVQAFQVQDEYTEGEMVALGSWMYRWESMLAFLRKPDFPSPLAVGFGKLRCEVEVLAIGILGNFQQDK